MMLSAFGKSSFPDKPMKTPLHHHHYHYLSDSDRRGFSGVNFSVRGFTAKFTFLVSECADILFRMGDLKL